MASNYNNLGDDDDDDSMEDIGFDMNENDDKIKIQMDQRFTKNKDKNKKSSHRGRIMISMNEEENDSPTPSFDGFDVPSPLNNSNNNINNNENNDNNAEFIISTNKNIESTSDQLAIEVTKTKTKTKKKKKKKKKKKYKTEPTSIDMVPLSSATNNQIDTNNGNNNSITIGENNTPNETENIESKPQKKKKKKRKKRKRYTRNDRIKSYVRSDLKWWLFIGTMLTIFIFSYSAITVGIAEDLVLFYRNYTDLICHYPTNNDSGGTQTEQKLIGDALTNKTIQQLFTSSSGGCIISLFGILISILLIFCKKCGKSARESNIIKIIYCIVFIIGVLLLFVWNILLTMNIIGQLHDLLNGLSHCEDEESNVVKNETKAKDEAEMLLNEFEILAVLILPMIFVIVCTAWYIKIKTTF